MKKRIDWRIMHWKSRRDWILSILLVYAEPQPLFTMDAPQSRSPTTRNAEDLVQHYEQPP